MKGAIAGQTWTGTHDYTAATVTVATPSSNSQAANKVYVDSVAFFVCATGDHYQHGREGDHKQRHDRILARRPFGDCRVLLPRSTLNSHGKDSRTAGC